MSDKLRHFPDLDPATVTTRARDRARLQSDVDLYLAAGGGIKACTSADNRYQERATKLTNMGDDNVNHLPGGTGKEDNKMNNFANYKNGTVTINTYRFADAAVTDVADILNAAAAGSDEILTATIETDDELAEISRVV